MNVEKCRWEIKAQKLFAPHELITYFNKFFVFILFQIELIFQRFIFGFEETNFGICSGQFEILLGLNRIKLFVGPEKKIIKCLFLVGMRASSWGLFGGDSIGIATITREKLTFVSFLLLFVCSHDTSLDPFDVYFHTAWKMPSISFHSPSYPLQHFSNASFSISNANWIFPFRSCHLELHHDQLPLDSAQCPKELILRFRTAPTHKLYSPFLIAHLDVLLKDAQLGHPCLSQ